MNAGDQACPETRPCPHPSSGGRKPARTLAGKADGMDVLLGNVESQHRHTAQLNTHANAYGERLIGSLRRECLDWFLVLNERHLRMVVREWAAHYNHGRPHRSLGPGIPDPPTGLLVRAQMQRHQFPKDSLIKKGPSSGDCIMNIESKRLRHEPDEVSAQHTKMEL